MSRRLINKGICCLVIGILMTLTSILIGQDAPTQTTDLNEKKEPAQEKVKKPEIAFEAPWGRHYKAGDTVKISLNPSMEATVKIRNMSEGESECDIIATKNEKDLPPKKIVLKTAASSKKPYDESKGLEAVSLNVNKGEIFFTVEQEAASFAEDEYAVDCFLQWEKKYGTVGKGFTADPEKNFVLTITADNQDTSDTEGSFKVFRGNYTDEIESVEFVLKNGETKIWKYPASQKAKTLDLILTQGNLRISCRQPDEF
jgi:hypothetical protein